MAYRLLQTMCKMNNQILLGPRHRPTMAKWKLYHNIVNGSASEHPMHALLAQWLQLASKAPEGYGKFFDKKDGPRPANEEESKPSTDKKTAIPPASSSSKSSDGQPGSKEPIEVVLEFKFEFGKDKDGKSTGGGTPLGGGSGDKKKLFLIGGLAIGALIGFYAFNEIVYEEIGWQEFVVKYLSKGVVAKMEVVNKKWVRVLLHPGSSVDSKSVWFNIGSVDSFDRNLENAQLDLGFDRLKFVPVVYKHEMEMPSTWGVLPTILIVCGIICVLRKC